MNPGEVRQRQRVEWQAAAPGWKKWEKEMLEMLQPISDILIESAGITSGYSVLDVATGSGEPALTIAKIIGPRGKVVGVDLSPGMIETAKERASSQGITNVNFQVVEDESLSAFQDGTFDAVVCRQALMFMPEPTKALSAFLRVLKHKGRASVSVWGSPEKAPLLGLIMKTIAKHLPDFKPPPPGTPGRFAIPNVGLLRDHFSKAGFSDFKGQVREVLTQADTAEKLWQMMEETGGFLIILRAKLPDEKNRAIRNDMIEAIRSMSPHGSAKFTQELIIGTGTKP